MPPPAPGDTQTLPRQWLLGPLERPTQGLAVKMETLSQPRPHLHALNSRADSTPPQRGIERTLQSHSTFCSYKNHKCVKVAVHNTTREGTWLCRRAGTPSAMCRFRSSAPTCVWI